VASPCILWLSKTTPDGSTRPMLTRISTASMAFFLATVTPLLRGQDQPASAVAPGPIASDRPAITNSSVVVPAGSFQMENGFLETNSQGESIVDGPESLVRFGVATRTELRFTVPDYFYNLNTTGSPGSGFGDPENGRPKRPNAWNTALPCGHRSQRSGCHLFFLRQT
jgi:hypothetical protein